MNTEPVIDEIQLLIQTGEHDQAKKLIKKLKHNKSLFLKNRYQIAVWFHALGQASNALKTIGPQLLPWELERASELEIRLQTRLGFMMSYLSAYQTAENIFNVLEPILRKNEHLVKTFLGTFLRFKASHYLRTENYEKSKQYYLEAVEYYTFGAQANPYLKSISLLGQADSLDGLGFYQEAITIVLGLLQDANLASDLVVACYTALGDYFLHLGWVKEACEYLSRARSQLPLNLSHKDTALLARSESLVAWFQKRPKEALLKISEAQRFYNQPNTNRSIRLELLGLEYFFRPHLKIKRHFAAVWTYPLSKRGLSPWRVLTGMPLLEDEKIHYWYKNNKWAPKTPFATLPKHPCWVLSHNLKLENYFAINLVNQSTLDLVSGLYFEANSKMAKPQQLTELQRRLLLILAASGEIGINMWALLEKLYPKDFSYTENRVLKLDQLFHQMRRLGFDVYREESGCFFRVEVETLIIMPFAEEPWLAEPRTFYWLAKKTKSFSMVQLLQMFDISKRTAARWIASWIHLNIILSVPTQTKESKYQIIQEF